ncbi:MAG: hypothetical protein ABJB11_17900 [Ferruginibacter sp.]
MCLILWAINIYRITIIDTKYLLIASVIGAVIGIILIPKFLKPTYSKFWKALINLAIGGGLFYFVLLYLNQAFYDKVIISNDFKILKTGTLGRGKFSPCFQPYATIDFNGVEKQLIFYCDFEKTIKSYSKVSLTYSKGLFGFNIIKSKQLKL